MNGIVAMALSVMMALAALLTVAPQSVLAQQSAGMGQSTVKLPSDVHPETYSRMPRVNREDLSTDEEKQAYDRLVKDDPDLVTAGVSLGGTGHRNYLPLIAENYRASLGMLRDKSGLERRYFEVAVLTATREMDEAYEWVSHARNSTKLMPVEIIDAIKNKKDTAGLPEKDAVLIQYAREMIRGPKVSSKTFAAMDRLFGKKQTLALTLVMGYYAGNALLFRGFDQHLDAARLRGEPYPFPELLP